MSAKWASALGLAITPMFVHERARDGQHYLLLDGVRGSFGISQQDHFDDQDRRSWAWSSGVLHHVTTTADQVIVERWDRSEISRYSLRSVTEKLDRFYVHISDSRADTNQNIATHAIESFRRLRSGFSPEEQKRVLPVFLLLIGSMLRSFDETSVYDRADEIVNAFDIDGDAPSALAGLSTEFVRHFISGFRKPLLLGSQQLETIPSLMVRHAGALVFQETHFDLIQPGATDMFGVPTAATVATNVHAGVHFTPPGLARAIVEQALDAYGPLPPEITILDPACGSGSILYEALRTLRDCNYDGNIKLIGFDESMYAVQMTRFLLSAAKEDWPEVKLSLSVECRSSLDGEPWPLANLILMNPPFVSLRNLNAEQKRLLTNILGRFAKGRPDLSMAFVERGLQSLALEGVLGTLVPAGILSMTYAQEWRRHLLDEAAMSFLAVFGELNLFRLATVETGCMVLRKSQTDSHPLYRSLWVGETKNSTPAALRYLRLATTQAPSDVEGDSWSLVELPTRILKNSTSWRPTRQTLRRELPRIEAHVPTAVGSLFDVKQGALPAPREAFIICQEQWADLRDIERRWFRPIAENKNIREGQILPGEYIFYPKSPELPPLDDEGALRNELPSFAAHLLRFKPALRKRRGKQERWWELGEDRKWLRVPSKKIVSSYFGQTGSFAYDYNGNHIVVQGYGWIRKWKPPRTISVDDVFNAYIAIFNSTFFVELLGEICPTVGGGQLNLSKRYTEKVRLPDLVGRIEQSAGVDPVIEDLSYFGSILRESGLSSAPRSKMDDLVRTLYGM